MTLLALLFTARFKSPNPKAKRLQEEGGPRYKRLLKKKSQCKKQASRDLISATNSGAAVSSFRSRLLECADGPDFWVCSAPKVQPSVDRSSVKASARDFAHKQASCCELDHHVSGCGNCGALNGGPSLGSTDARSIKRCACKQISYCNKSCQQAHWTVHKHVCTASGGKTRCSTPTMHKAATVKPGSMD